MIWRKRVLVPLLLLALVGGHTLLWQWAERALESGFADWRASRRALGWTVTSGPPTRGGWPLRAQLVVPDLVVSANPPANPLALEWSASRARLDVPLLHPRLLSVSVSGQQELRLGGLPPVPFRADGSVLSVPLDPGVPPRVFDLDIDHLRAGISSGDGQAALTLTRLQMHAETKPGAAQGEPALAITLTAGDIDLPPGNWAFGPRIASVLVEAVLNGPLPRLATLYARANGWRDGGGTLELRRVALGWGPLGLSGSATVALDDHMQPMGAATARVVGPAQTLDALAAGHVIGNGTAASAKAVLGLMSRIPEGGGAPEVEVPLTLQDRALAVGRIPLARVPPLIWPNSP